MKKILFIAIALLAIVACNRKTEPNLPQEQTQTEQTGQPEEQEQDTTGGGGTEEPEEPVAFTVSLSFDSATNKVTAVPSDSSVEYAMFIWLKEDFILDYGDDFSDQNVKEAMQSYVDMCIRWKMAFPTFLGTVTVGVYDGLDKPYPGKEFIAMAAEIDEDDATILGNVTKLFFRTGQGTGT